MEGWTCNTCTNNDNKESDLKCTVCGEARGEKDATDFGNTTNKRSIPGTIGEDAKETGVSCLLSTKKDKVLLNEAVLNDLRKNFTDDHKTVVIIAAGLLGMGKSTWLNSILREFGVTVEFESSNRTLSVTEGLWVYPKPLRDTKYKEVQFLLMDMEGMGGMRKGTDSADLSRALNKLFSLGMLVASVFTIHTSQRPSYGDVKILQDSFHIISEMKKTLGIEFPRLIMLVRDTDKITTIEGGSEDFLQVVKDSCKMDELLFSLLEARAKPAPPKEYSEKKSYEALNGSPYQKFNQNFLQDAAKFYKKETVSPKPIPVQTLFDMIEELGNMINMPKWQYYFKGDFETSVKELLLKPTQNAHSRFEEKSMSIAKTVDVQSTSVEKFRIMLQAIQEDVEKTFKLEISELINPETRSTIVDTTLIQLRASMKNTGPENHFLFRKEMETKNDELRKELNEIRKQNEQKQLNISKVQDALEKKRIELESQLKKQEADYKSELKLIKEEAQKKEMEYVQLMKKQKEDLQNMLEQNKSEFLKEKQILQKTLEEDLGAIKSSAKTIQEQEKLISEVKHKFNDQIEELKKAEENKLKNVEIGFAEKQFNKATELYSTGLFELAFLLFEEAANLHHSRAKYYLGVMSYHGSTVFPKTKKDLAKAVKYLSEAADEGITEAEDYYGDVLMNGDGVPRDENKALHYYGKAAAKGYINSLVSLARYYSKKKHPIAQQYVERCQSSPEYSSIKGEYYYFKQDYKNAFACLRFEQDPQSLFYIGEMYINGHIPPKKNRDLAFENYLNAATKGYPPAMHRVANFWRYGLDPVCFDHSQVEYWLGLAAKQDYIPAIQELISLKEKNGKQQEANILQSQLDRLRKK